MVCPLSRDGCREWINSGHENISSVRRRAMKFGLTIFCFVCPSSGDEVGESKNSGLTIIWLDGVIFKKNKFWATEEVSAYSRDGRDMSYHGLS